MEKLTDNEKLRNIIDALGVKVPEFRVKLKYSSNTTIYNVFKGLHGISSNMLNRIMQAYPEVSYLYIKRGQGTPLRVGPAATNQNNILGLSEESLEQAKDKSILEFLSLPERTSILEQQIIELIEEIKKLKGDGI